MAVQCSQCGEELLGSVNRCWNCGQEVLSHAGESELPPVRSVPLPVSSDENNSLVQLEKTDSLPSEDVAEAAAVEQSPDSLPVPQVESPLQVRLAVYPRHTAATGGALGSIALGILALVGVSITSWGGLVTAALGIGMGLWGLFSKQRTAAAIGLFLCCLAVIISGYFIAVELFIMINGHSPFDIINGQIGPEDMPL